MRKIKTYVDRIKKFVKKGVSSVGKIFSDFMSMLPTLSDKEKLIILRSFLLCLSIGSGVMALGVDSIIKDR